MWRIFALGMLVVTRIDGYEKTEHPKHNSLSPTEPNRVVELAEYDDFVSDILSPIMRVRPPGTRGHRKVKKFIKKQFENLNWTVTLDEFNSNTPLGEKHFTNIIATLNPNAQDRLVVAAHYDSKLFTPVNGKYFVAATDSAVPCAMMIELARTLTPHFVRKQEEQQVVPNVTLEMIFFDGEEAFVEWSANDSLYGSRHLAKVLENKARLTGWNGPNKIPSIKAFMLLDLIGAANPVFYGSFGETADLYKRLQAIETRLTNSGNLKRNSGAYFPGMAYIGVEDDHIPFLKRGVPILHLIPWPFPPCWHKICDDMESLDHNSIQDLIKIIRVFLAEYFSLDIN